MTGIEIVQEVVSILVAGLTSFATGIGEGVSALAQSIFLTGTGESQTISVFGTLVLVFSAIALTIGLSRRIFSWIETLGGNK